MKAAHSYMLLTEYAVYVFCVQERTTVEPRWLEHQWLDYHG